MSAHGDELERLDDVIRFIVGVDLPDLSDDERETLIGHLTGAVYVTIEPPSETPTPEPSGLLPHLAWTARRARCEAGCTLAQVAAELGAAETTPSRFEHGQAWPENPDATINAYSRVTGVSVADLWLRAIEAWDEERSNVSW